MKLTIPAFANGARIPDEFAFGVMDTKEHVRLGLNRNPHVMWSDLPAGTKSLVLICVDTDVPTKGDDVNQEGKTVPSALPRTDFYHWVLINIDPKMCELKKADDSDGVTAKGKQPGKKSYGVTGINDYTHWFANDPEMAGQYGGYDGPCPPWNDELLHHYRFRLYALDVPQLQVDVATGPAVMQAMQGHILEQAEWVGTYSLNPAVNVNA